MRPRNPNFGHGHVYPRPDGYLARCGGPALCNECREDQVEFLRETTYEAALPSNPLAALDAKLPITKSTPVVFPGEPGLGTKLTVEAVEEARRLLDANEIPPFHEDPMPKQNHAALHPSTFEYLKPTDEQIAAMARVRQAFKTLADLLADELPDGPDKTAIFRNVRTTAMWANVAITRHSDGAPRLEDLDGSR